MTRKTTSTTSRPAEKCKHLYSVVVARTFEERGSAPLYNGRSKVTLRGSQYGWKTVCFKYCPYCRLDLTKPLPREKSWLLERKESWFTTRLGKAYRKKFPEKVIDPYDLHDLL